MEQTQLSHQRRRLSNNRECLTISDRKGISDRQSGMQVLQIKKIRIVGYLVNIYHGAKQRPNSHTSGKSCTDAALVRMGALQSTIPGLSSSLVSASTSVLPVYLATPTPHNNLSSPAKKYQPHTQIAEDKTTKGAHIGEPRLGQHRAQLE